MFFLLLMIISYGAFMLLLMPETVVGIILTTVILMLGITLIIYKKFHKVTFQKDVLYFLIPTTILIAAPLGSIFYNRWLPSSKLKAVADMLHMPANLIPLLGALMLSGISIYFIYALLQTIVKIISDSDPQKDLVKNLVSCIVVSVVMVVLCQVMIGAEVFLMGYFNFICGAVIVSSVLLFMCSLFGRTTLSIFFGAGLFMVISTVNAYVYKFRGRLFEPIDVLSAGTAMNVAENYSLLPVPSRILIGWVIFFAVAIALWWLQRKSNTKITAKNRYILLAVCIVSSVAISFYAGNLKPYHWNKQGAVRYGYVLDFASKFKEISVPKPDSYSMEVIAKLQDQYATDSAENESKAANPPHIIAIMNEAFSDLSVAGEFSTNAEVMPFISSLKENTVSGYALTSVYGGNTANSEYEFLTGNSLAWLSPNVVPYQQYISPSTYSIVSYLKSLYNYKCIAMHPFLSDGWNRPIAYEHLGFDKCYFIEDFPQEDFVREYVSDREMFEFIIETFEESKENPLFLFGVTMQNHGGYTYSGENYTKSISLNGFESEFPEVEQYLSLIHETDKAVEQLISYFQGVDEDVVIVLFGDHQPKIDEAFYETIAGTTAETLDEKQKRYEVPFFVWANYDIEEEYVDHTSLNYLTSYVYDVAGFPLPPYNQFLREMEDAIPAINANGFYSLDNGCYLSFEKANENELFWLDLYETLQYNNIFDKKQRSKILFPSMG